jgi:hypothetical protein
VVYGWSTAQLIGSTDLAMAPGNLVSLVARIQVLHGPTSPVPVVFVLMLAKSLAAVPELALTVVELHLAGEAADAPSGLPLGRGAVSLSPAVLAARAPTGGVERRRP